MTSRKAVFNNEDVAVVVTTDKSIIGASEIKLVCQKGEAVAFQVTLTGGGIVADSSTQYTATVPVATMVTLAGGVDYKWQSQVTDSTGALKIIELDEGFDLNVKQALKFV